MAWNQPDDDNNKPKNPWGQQDGDDKQPPELDKVFKDIGKQFAGLLGGNKSPQDPQQKPSWSLTRLLGFLLVGLVAVFVISGFFRVEANQQAVLLEAGVSPLLVTSGLHWRNPLTQTLVLVPAGQRHYQQTRDFLTADAKVVSVTLEVDYHLADPAAYVRQLQAPLTLLQGVATAQLRAAIGGVSLDQLLTTAASSLSQQLEQSLSAALARRQAGLAIDSLSLSQISAPAELATSMKALKTARQEAAAQLQQAKAQANVALLEAKKKAQQLLLEAKTYKKQVVDLARGKTSRFNSQLAAYRLAPEVTRERLYLQTMEQLLSQSRKLLVTGDNKQLLSLPLAGLLQQKAAAPEAAKTAAGQQGKEKSQAAKQQAVGGELVHHSIPSLYGSSHFEETP